MKFSKIFLSICVVASVFSWINAHYDPSKFESNNLSVNNHKEINIKKS